jgi:hypothetical protein
MLLRAFQIALLAAIWYLAWPHLTWREAAPKPPTMQEKNVLDMAQRLMERTDPGVPDQINTFLHSDGKIITPDGRVRLVEHGMEVITTSLATAPKETQQHINLCITAAFLLAVATTAASEDGAVAPRVQAIAHTFVNLPAPQKVTPDASTPEAPLINADKPVLPSQSAQ